MNTMLLRHEQESECFKNYLNSLIIGDDVIITKYLQLNTASTNKAETTRVEER